MVFSVQQVKYEFLAYIKGLGGDFGDWYVTGASDPEGLLFGAHGVRPDADPWIYKPMLTYRATRTVVRYFTEVLRADGVDPDSLADDAVFAVAFRKSSATRPAAAPPVRAAAGGPP